MSGSWDSEIYDTIFLDAGSSIDNKPVRTNVSISIVSVEVSDGPVGGASQEKRSHSAGEENGGREDGFEFHLEIWRPILNLVCVSAEEELFLS
jgi:hypothetical protein